MVRDGDADIWTLVELLITLESDADNNQRIMISWSRMGRKYGPVRMIGCGVGGAGARMLEQDEMDPALGLNMREPGCIFQVQFEALSDKERLKYAEPHDDVLHSSARLAAAATKKAVAVGAHAVEGAATAAAAVGAQAGAHQVLHKAAESTNQALRRMPTQRVLNKAAEGAELLHKAGEGAGNVLRRLPSLQNLRAPEKEVKFGELFFDAQSAAVANRWVKEIQTMSESVQSHPETWADEQQYLEKARIARTHDVVGIRKLDLDKTRTYVWESTGSGVAGIEAVGKDIGGGAIGVQVRDLEEVLEGFTGEVWALPLRSAHDQETRAHTRLLEVLEKDQLSYMQTLLTRIHEAFFKRSYQMNCLKQCSVIAPSLTSLANCCCPCASCNESVFCSEFAVDVYQALGIMSVDIDPEKVIPCDFLGGYAGFPKFGRPIPLRLHQEHMQHAGDHDAFSQFYGDGDPRASGAFSKHPEFHISPKTKLAHQASHRLQSSNFRHNGLNEAVRLEFDTIFPDGESWTILTSWHPARPVAALHHHAVAPTLDTPTANTPPSPPLSPSLPPSLPLSLSLSLSRPSSVVLPKHPMQQVKNLSPFVELQSNERASNVPLPHLTYHRYFIQIQVVCNPRADLAIKVLELDQIQNSKKQQNGSERKGSLLTALYRKKNDTDEGARLRAKRQSGSKRALLVPYTERHGTPTPSPPPVPHKEAASRAEEPAAFVTDTKRSPPPAPYEEADSRAEEPAAFATMQEEGNENCSCDTSVILSSAPPPSSVVL